MSIIEASLQNIRENTDGLKKIIPALISHINTVEAYYKDKA